MIKRYTLGIAEPGTGIHKGSPALVCRYGISLQGNYRGSGNVLNNDSSLGRPDVTDGISRRVVDGIRTFLIDIYGIAGTPLTCLGRISRVDGVSPRWRQGGFRNSNIIQCPALLDILHVMGQVPTGKRRVKDTEFSDFTL